MVKKALLAFSFCALLFGAELQSDLENLIPAHKEQISLLLENERSYIDERGNVNYASLCSKLKALGILDLGSGANMQLGFLGSNDNAILMIKAVGLALENLGYKYFLSLGFENNPARWSVVLSSRSALGPGELYTELAKQNIYIKKILKNEQGGFVYALDLSKTRIKTDSLLETPIRPKTAYFVSLSNASLLNVTSQDNDNWQPFIQIFDKNLKLIKVEKTASQQESLRLSLPENAAYALIDDLFSLENIKHGLVIELR